MKWENAFQHGLSSLYGVLEKEKFATPSVIESYEPDRTKVTVEFEIDDSDMGAKKGASGHVNKGSVQEDSVSDHVMSISGDVNYDFEVLMGAYRSDFRENARKVFLCFCRDSRSRYFKRCKKTGIFGEKCLARYTCDERGRSSCSRRRRQGRQVDSKEVI